MRRKHEPLTWVLLQVWLDVVIIGCSFAISSGFGGRMVNGFLFSWQKALKKKMGAKEIAADNNIVFIKYCCPEKLL
jgi:hypothetical protein